MLLAAAAGLGLAGCADDDPTGVGSGLLSGDGVRTFEVVLDASRVFGSDASFAGYLDPWEMGRVVAARSAGGSLNVHALARFGGTPASVEYVDTAGVTRTDSDPTFFGGELILPVDSTAMRGAGSVSLRVLSLDEAWDARSATWDLRVDTAGVELPWTDPGGTAGASLDTATWISGMDSLFFDVDSQTVAAWTDTDDDSRGVLIVAETDGARFFASGPQLRLHARPSGNPDTVATAMISPVDRTFIYDPGPGDPAELRVGGGPSWRAFLRFREGLDTLTVTGPDGETEYRLGDLAINSAALSLMPIAPPAGFEPEDSIAIGGQAALDADGVPLSRTPLGTQLTGAAVSVAPEAFSGGVTDRVEFTATSFVSALIESGGDGSVPNTVALLPATVTFGFAAFAPPDAPADIAPRLRLIVTTADRVEFP